MFRRAHALAAMAAAAITAVTLASPASAAPPVPPAPAITPGAGLAIYDASSAFGASCTLGFLATGSDGSRYAFTAGHCDKGGNALMPYQTPGNYQRIGRFTASEDGNGWDPDIATIRLDSNLPIDTRVLARRPVAGLTSTVGSDDTLCFYGMRSGLRCGQVQWSTESAAIDSRVSFSATAVGGDSGAPVYRIGSDGTATAVGVLDSTDDASGVVSATLIEPYLKKWGLTLDVTPRVPAPAQPVGYQPGR